MSGSREYRPHRRGADDDTVELQLHPQWTTPLPPPEEPWWKNVNSRMPPPPKVVQAARPAQPSVEPQDRTPASVRSRHARATSRRRGRTQLPLMIAVGVIAIVTAAVLVVVGLSKFDVWKGRVLDVSPAEIGVARILTDPVDGYGATNVSDVICNGGNDPEIKKGGTFMCEVVVDGRKRQVLVAFQDDSGTYEVDRPR